MLTNFKVLFLVYGVAALLGVGAIHLIYPLLGIPIFPGLWMFFVIVLLFLVVRIFQTAHEDDVTVRCGLFGHNMMNVRLESGALDPKTGQYVKAIRVYACKRCGDNTVKIEP